MKMQAIPGLDGDKIRTLPGLDADLSTETSVEPSKPSGLRLLSFDGKIYDVPENHKYGKCETLGSFRKLGPIYSQGAYGTVYKAEHKASKDIVALKKMRISFDKHDGIPHSHIREIKNLKLLQHENIVCLKDVAVRDSLDSIYLVMEFCDYDLAKILDEAKPNLKEEETKCLMMQLFKGLKYLHDNYIVHRDLKTSNLLLKKDGTLKIGDFGLSRHYTYPAKPMTIGVVTLCYRAPELLLMSDIQTTAIDMWSAACVFAELLLHRILLPGNSEAKQLELIIRLLGTPNDKLWPGFSDLPLVQNFVLVQQPYNNIKKLFSFLSESGISLLQKLFIYDPRKRGTALQCLQSQYFKDNPIPCTPSELEFIKKLDAVEIKKEVEAS